MKLLNLFMPIMLCVVCSNAQQLKIPDPVQKAQRQKYPMNKVLHWSKNQDQYAAEMEIIEVKHVAKYDVSGTWISTETAIEPGELPAEIQAFMHTNFAEQAIAPSFKINYADGSLQFKTGVSGITLFFDAMGRLIRKEVDTAQVN